MTAWIIAKFWPWILALVAAPVIYFRGKAAARAEERDYAMKRMIRRSGKRTEIEDAIDQDTDLVSRAIAAGVVRPDAK